MDKVEALPRLPGIFGGAKDKHLFERSIAWYERARILPRHSPLYHALPLGPPPRLLSLQCTLLRWQ